MTADGCIYDGTVVHKRLKPKVHALSYRVFSVLLDVDRIDEVTARLRLFSRNRFNLFSFHDRDHGGGEGLQVGEQARATFASAGLAPACHRIELLCYPRVLGYGFNPISVYYGYDAAGALAGVIYEVNNTFGERRSYVVAVGTGGIGHVYAHDCAKALYVSPFTEMAGRYGFRLIVPNDEVLVGVSLRDRDGPVLRTHFRGAARTLTDATLARLAVTLPLSSFKVMGAIHYEAMRLWLKGVPLTARPAAPRYAVTHVGVVPTGAGIGSMVHNSQSLPKVS